MDAGQLRWLTKIGDSCPEYGMVDREKLVTFNPDPIGLPLFFISFLLLPSIFDSDGTMHLSSVNVVAVE